MSARCLLVNGLVDLACMVICLLSVGQNPTLQGAAPSLSGSHLVRAVNAETWPTYFQGVI